MQMSEQASGYEAAQQWLLPPPHEEDARQLVSVPSP